MTRDALEGETQQDVEAEKQQDHGHDRGSRLGGQLRQDGGTQEGAHGTGDRDPPHHTPVDVAELPVRDTRYEGGPDLGEVHGGRRGGRVGADRQEQRRRGDAVGHAEAAVDELGGKTDQGDENDGAHVSGAFDAGAAAGRSRRGGQVRRMNRRGTYRHSIDATRTRSTARRDTRSGVEGRGWTQLPKCGIRTSYEVRALDRESSTADEIRLATKVDMRTRP